MGKPTAPLHRPAAVLNWSEIRNFKDFSAPIETLEDDVFAEDSPVLFLSPWPAYFEKLLNDIGEMLSNTEGYFRIVCPVLVVAFNHKMLWLNVGLR